MKIEKSLNFFENKLFFKWEVDYRMERMIGEAPITSYIFVGTGERLIPEY